MDRAGRLEAENVSLRARVAEQDAEILVLRRRVDERDGEIDMLRQQVAELTARVEANPRNSSKPPSSEGYTKPAPKSRRTPSGRKPGKQLMTLI